LPGCGAHRSRATPGSNPANPPHPGGGARIPSYHFGNHIWRAHGKRWHLFKVQSLVGRRSGGLAQPRRSGYHLSPLRGEATTGSGSPFLILIVILIVISASSSRRGNPRLRLRLRLRAAVRTRRVHRRLPGCGAHRSRATPGSSPRKSPAPRRRCQNSLLPFRKPYLASSWKALAPLQGAIIRLTTIRRSRPASTLRLPSVTPSG
jgi:hypothetical protein